MLSKRDYIYDYTRIIAICAVVIGHSAYLYITSTYGGIDYKLPENVSPVYYSGFFDCWRFLSSFVYQFHMPLFFIISGAVFALKPIPPIATLLKSKIIRLVIPFFVYGLFFMLPIRIVTDYYHDCSLFQILFSFITCKDCGHLWFLIALFICFVLFTLLVKLVYKLLNKWYLRYSMLLLICFVLQLVSPYIRFVSVGLSFIFFFAIGYVFQKIKHKIKNFNLWLIVGLFILSVIAEIILYQLNFDNYIINALLGSTMVLLFSLIINYICRDVHFSKLWLLFVAALFYVYIFHDPLNYLILKICFMNGGQILCSQAGCICYLLMRTIGVFVVSLVLGLFIIQIKSKVKALRNR